MNTSEFQVNEIRKRIKEIRYEKGYTQDNMADMLCISQNAYHKIENGYCKLSLSKFIQIAKALEVEITELINGPMHQQILTKYYLNKSIS